MNIELFNKYKVIERISTYCIYLKLLNIELLIECKVI